MSALLQISFPARERQPNEVAVRIARDPPRERRERLFSLHRICLAQSKLCRANRVNRPFRSRPYRFDQAWRARYRNFRSGNRFSPLQAVSRSVRNFHPRGKRNGTEEKHAKRNASRHPFQNDSLGQGKVSWRMGGVSNPGAFRHTRFPGVHNRPLCHPS